MSMTWLMSGGEVESVSICVHKDVVLFLIMLILTVGPSVPIILPKVISVIQFVIV